MGVGQGVSNRENACICEDGKLKYSNIEQSVILKYRSFIALFGNHVWIRPCQDLHNNLSEGAVEILVHVYA